MSGNLLALAKWFPSSIAEHEDAFSKCRALRVTCFTLISNILKVAGTIEMAKSANSDGSVINDSVMLEDLEKICLALEQVLVSFTLNFQEILLSKSHPLLLKKFNVFKELLRKVKLQLCYILQSFICDISCHFLLFGDAFLTFTLRLSNSYNNLLTLDATFSLSDNSNSVCNNTCPYLRFALRKFSVTRFLQILSNQRTEYCCHNLIDCLLEAYKMHEILEEDNSSDNSSVEIYMALTRHLSPPADLSRRNDKNEDTSLVTTDHVGSFMSLEKMISEEESNVIIILKQTQKVAPMMLGKDLRALGETTNGKSKIDSKITQKVLDYYEQILWTEVGNYLEHVILWWASSPLSSRPPRSSQHLREWINNFAPSAEVPPVILAALLNLADALGVHITYTLWDQCFRQALVAAKKTGNQETGKLFCNVIQELVALCNLYEVTSDWTTGAPLNELPLVEQIPVLHRLDHTLHTTRLWAISECRKIAGSWNVKDVFAITHSQITNCLTQLSNLRLADHTVAIEKGGMEVHVEVCALMRSKLVSEVKENIQQLKDSPKECISCLASICKIINLANLQMIFPAKSLWRINREDVPNSASSYVKRYLEKMLLPVLNSIDDDAICNMILTLVCESWLDHIYNQKIKFSHWGAFQLLCDFAYVSMWIEECPSISDRMKKKLVKNEILRRCEGVGRLLLRCPGEKLNMVDKKMVATLYNNGEMEEDTNHHQQMPAEMYVPNQEQWLELRAARRKSLFSPLCC
ncbi:coiled-coil domain-containing protein 142 [Euwallacea similis]|uniref:coiled-coil domain-containing protein 142 n=1 Tax=Euwallacea similis TaxID=1736056 RepID=UPI0034501E63